MFSLVNILRNLGQTQLWRRLDERLASDRAVLFVQPLHLGVVLALHHFLLALDPYGFHLLLEDLFVFAKLTLVPFIQIILLCEVLSEDFFDLTY